MLVSWRDYRRYIVKYRVAENHFVGSNVKRLFRKWKKIWETVSDNRKQLFESREITTRVSLYKKFFSKLKKNALRRRYVFSCVFKDLLSCFSSINHPIYMRVSRALF